MGEQKMDHIRLNGSFVSGMKELKEHKEVLACLHVILTENKWYQYGQLRSNQKIA